MAEGGAHALCQAGGQLSRVLPAALESELTQTQAEGQRQAREHEALLNTKVKSEAETATTDTCWEKGRTSILVTPWTTATPRALSKRPPPPQGCGRQNGV